MLPYLIAGAIGFGIGKLFENGGETFMTGGQVKEEWKSYLKESRVDALIKAGYSKNVAKNLSSESWDSLEKQVQNAFKNVLISEEVESMKSMMESLYTYGGLDKDNRYLEKYKISLGNKLFNKTFDEYRKELVEGYDVDYGTYTDSEGLTYSSLRKKYEGGGETFMAGGKITTNEDVLNSFLTSSKEVKANNLSTHFNEYDDFLLLRNYYTLIATRKGNDVKITNVKHSKTTSAITNRLKALAEEMGYNVSYVSKFGNGGETFMAGGTTNEDIVFEYPKDSNGRVMSWINVGTGNMEIASKTGTVGQVRDGHQLIVLKSETPNKVDYHIFVDYLPEENKINMVRGKFNSEPSPKYQSYINDLFRMLKISQTTRDYQDEDIANQVYVKRYLINNFGNPPKGCQIKATELGVEIHFDSTNKMSSDWAMKIADKYGYPSGNFEMRYSSGNVPITYVDTSKIAKNTSKSGKGYFNFGETFMAGGRITKYVSVYVVQGNYGGGFEDLTAHDNRKDAIAEMRVYDDNESYPHRVIQRRVLRTDYEKGKYGKGGILGKSARLEYITDAYASDDLQQQLRDKLGIETDSLGDNYVISFAYTDYGGDFLDKVAIEFFQEKYPENTLVEATSWSGQNAYVFGEPAKEWIETTEDYPLGFEDIEDFYYEKQNEQESEDFNFFLDEISRDYTFDKEAVLDWLRENKSGYYGMTTQGLDFSSEDLTEELVNEGLIEETDEDEYGGGGLPKKRRRSASIQYGRSDTAVDKTRVGKPVGYRFSNAKANQLRKDPYAKPTEAQVKKYLGKGIYKENRKRHSDKDRNEKL